MACDHFITYGKKDILEKTHLRRFETKIGEVIQSPEGDLAAALERSAAKYVLFGIAEDIGVRANYGKSGAATAWQSFLPAFLNVQSNDFFTGEDVLLAGHFDFGDISSLIENNAPNFEEGIAAYRHALHTVDEEVEELTKQITFYNKIPVVIGGGHNNAYPLIKGTAKGLHKAGRITLAQINCISLDAHTDYRPAEGRHSGNGFRYAEEDGYLLKYCVIGVHENYIPQNVWLDMVNNPFLDLITYEDIFIHSKRSFMQAVAHAAGFAEDNYTGIELDMDSVENALSSAVTPCGISPAQARQYINYTAAHVKAAYLHICEAAARMEDGRKNETAGKLISYLVSDFIKAS